jgi:hypothetical protein
VSIVVIVVRGFAIMVIARNVIRAGIVMAVIGVINILASKNKASTTRESDAILLMKMALIGIWINRHHGQGGQQWLN